MKTLFVIAATIAVLFACNPQMEKFTPAKTVEELILMNIFPKTEWAEGEAAHQFVKMNKEQIEKTLKIDKLFDFPGTDVSLALFSFHVDDKTIKRTIYCHKIGDYYFRRSLYGFYLETWRSNPSINHTPEDFKHIKDELLIEILRGKKEWEESTDTTWWVGWWYNY